MRIVLVVSALGAGGAEKVIIGLANHWATHQHSVKLISFGSGPPYFSIDPQIELSQLDMPSGSRPLWRAIHQTWRRTMALRSVICNFDPDVVIAFLTKINVLTLMATRSLGVPVIVSERNNPRMQQIRASWRWARDISYRHANRVVVPSSGIATCLPSQIRKRIQIIPNSLSLSVDPPPRLPERRRLIAVGRLVTQKGFDLLLRAFAQIADDFPRWNLTIYGEGELRQELERLRDSLGLTKRITLPGNTERSGQWLEEGEIFVLSSRYEGFANVLIEAMSVGMAIVSFDCPWGPSEIIKDDVDGVLVPAESVDSLAEAMRRLIANPELRQRLGIAALRNVHRFEHQNVIAIWDDLLLDLVSRPKLV